MPVHANEGPMLKGERGALLYNFLTFISSILITLPPSLPPSLLVLLVTPPKISPVLLSSCFFFIIFLFLREDLRMLQRAASNAYSWWWASHIRTRQSKWLEQNLQDMEEKVKNMLKLIDEDGDTFAKRAEMYYRKRPELISYVEESYRAYRALAGRYDHISGELQSANTTIATVFPEKAQFGMDDDEEEEDDDGHGSSTKMANAPKEFPDIIKGKNLEVPKIRKKAAEEALTFPTKKPQPKKDDSSHLSKTEGVVEIDVLQKEILALQTEKEFVKSSYESRLAKYWEIEKKIAAMQEKVCSLQDEFHDQGTVIEDEEARTLMASTALKSCQDTLILLQEKQQRSDEEVRVENQRIKAAHERLEALKNEFLHNQADDQWSSSDNKNFKILEQVDSLQEESLESKSVHENTIEELQMGSGASVTMTEMVEKIDELVDKVINLEAAVSSQTSLIKRLRLENDELQANLRSLEDDKATKIKDSSNFSENLGELEKELHGVQDLNRNIEEQNNSLQIQFSEAQYNLEHISEKLQSVEQLDGEVEITGFEQAQVGEFLNSNPFLEFEQIEDMTAPFDDSVIANEKIIDEALGPSPFSIKDQEEVLAQPKRSSNLDGLFEEAQELNPWNEFLKQESLRANDGVSKFQQEQLTEDDEPDWKQLFLNGLGDREKILLAEYTAVLRNYKDAKRKLSELEQKSCDNLFETTLQLRELKTSNAMKDEEIRSLRKKLGFLQTSFENTSMKLFEESQRNRLLDSMVKELDSPTLNSNHQDSISLSPYHDAAATETQYKSPADEVTATHPGEEEVKTILIDEKQTVSTIEEKFRRTIDEVLEENLEFWLRFSTSFHQIQKFQIEIDDLLAEFLRLKENKKQDGSTATTSRSTSTTSSTDQSRNLDALQIFKHLTEIQTRMAIWIDRNVLLKDELQCRFSSLCNIQEEISSVSEASSEAKVVQFTSLMAAKFQGEVLDMQQENNKVADELQAGLDYVRGLEIEVENSLAKLSEDFNLSSSTKNQPEIKHSPSRTRIPLRSFLFGVKVKRRKSSIFQCMNPAFQKQYSDLKAQIHI